MLSHILLLLLLLYSPTCFGPFCDHLQVSYDKSQAIPCTVYDFIYLTGCESTIHIQ